MAEVWVVVGNVVRVAVVEASVVLVPDDRVEGEVGVLRAEDSFLACRQEMSRLLRSLKSFFSAARCSSSEAARTSRRYRNDLD